MRGLGGGREADQMKEFQLATRVSSRRQGKDSAKDPAITLPHCAVWKGGRDATTPPQCSAGLTKLKFVVGITLYKKIS